MPASMIIVVMGVAGSGKTTIGMRLAQALTCAFLDADSLHAAAAIAQMRSGRGLTDEQRTPWLSAVRARLREAAARGETLVVACSALKQSYRTFLGEGVAITWVFLKGAPDLIQSRLEQRIDHFAAANLLPSQMAVLEEPPDAITVDVAPPPAAIVDEILARLCEKGLPLFSRKGMPRSRADIE